MHTEGIGLTEAEWQVMEVLWERAPLNGREMSEIMAERMGWNRSTTLTMLRRMEAKGAVAADMGEPKQFRPKIAREDAALRETESFLDRVYHGSVRMMVSAMTEKQALSKTEIDELYAMLRELEEGNDRD